MSHSNNKYKVVFLIDINFHKEKSSENELLHCTKRITLTAFRLLSFFANLSRDATGTGQLKKKSRLQNLLWSSKFYDSKSLSLKCMQHRFREFKSRIFQEFENEVGSKLDEKTKGKDCNRSARKAPCEYLRYAIKELLTDLQWDSPDIFSPVKRPSRKHKNADTSPSVCGGNFIFLFTHCPNSQQELRKFAGKMVLDEEILADALMGQDLLDKLRQQNMKLYWIDDLLYSEEIDIRSLKIVDKALGKVAGSIIPLSSLVQLPRPSSSIHSVFDNLKVKSAVIAEESRRDDEANKRKVQCVFPHLPVIEWYTRCTRQTASSDKTPEVMSITMLSSEGKELCILSIMQADQSFLRGAISAQSYRVILCESFNIKRSSQLNNASHYSVSISCLDFVLSGLCKVLRAQITSKKRSLDSSEMLDVSLPASSLQDKNVLSSTDFSREKLENSNLRVYGVLTSSLIRVESCDTAVSYICCADSASNVETFETLLMQLAVEQKSLVLFECTSLSLYILQPLTKTSGVLTQTSLSLTLDIEKLLSESYVDSEVVGSTGGETTQDKGWSDMVHRLLKGKTAPKIKQEASGSGEVKSFHAQSVEKTYLPGSRKMLVNLIDKLNERVSQLEFLSAEEVTFLQDLQQTYRQENQPMKPLASTPVVTAETNKGTSSVASNEDRMVKDKSVGGGTKRRSADTVPSRGQLLVNKSRQSVQSSDDCNVQTSKDTYNKDEADHTAKLSSSTAVNTDFKDEEELSTYLKETYVRIYDSDDSLVSTAQMIVTVSLHFMKEKSADNPQESCHNFLKERFILQPSVLREKYQHSASAEEKNNKLKEFQMQVVLRFEVLSSLQSDDQSMSEDNKQVEEIVTLLRTISFSTEPAYLSDFMKNTLVENYIHTLPQTLGSIYDELMQPLPEILESLLSPDKSGSESVFSRSVLSDELDNTRDVSLDVISASQPVRPPADVLLERTKRNSRSRRLIHHPSLADMGSQRQIVVSAKIATDKKKSKRSSKKKVKKDLGGAFHHEKVILERRQSVAIMESVRRSPRGRTKILPPKPGDAADAAIKSPPFKSPSARRKIIAETPSHKQKTRPVWKQQEKERRRTCTVTDIKVVTESPVKSDVVKDSPSQKKKALHLVRRSFYSAGPLRRTRSLAQSVELAEKISGRRKHLSGRLSSILLNNSPNISTEDFKSPEKNSSFLLSQLMGSPSTPSSKKTPRKAPSVTTPAKFISESPSMHTRSKSPAVSLSFGKPKALFRESPENEEPKSARKSLRLLESGKKSTSSGFVCTSPRGVTPKKTDSPGILSLDKNMKPKGKIAATPTRQSVRAALFCKSPGPKITEKRGESGMSLPLKTEASTSLHKTRLMKRKSSVVSDDNILDHSSKMNFNEASSSSVSAAQPLKSTPSPLKTKRGRQTTPSPGEKLLKTPTSLDKWPRKKRASDMTSPYSSSNNAVSTNSKSSKSLFSKVDENIQLSEENEQIFSDLSQSTLLSQNSQTSVVSKKRELNLSPENMASNFSPRKRRRILQEQTQQSKETSSLTCLNKAANAGRGNMRPSHSLHSRLLSKRMSSIGSVTSEGFPTDRLGSQGSQNVHSQQSVCSLSQVSWGSEDCFSSVSDEVFVNVSQGGLKSEEDEERSDSPVFGSSRKRKRQPSQTVNNQPSEADNESDTGSQSVSESTSDRSKISPGGKKFSPNVSAKSLMHLMNSPLLKSPMDKRRKEVSPKIDQDSLNVRRRRMSGRTSRRSLNLQK